MNEFAAVFKRAGLPPPSYEEEKPADDHEARLKNLEERFAEQLATPQPDVEPDDAEEDDDAEDA